MDRPVLTLDMDWAPEAAIRSVAGALVRAGVRCTWFATHLSPEVESVASRPDLFEVGVHPNRLPGSTHGGSDEEVLRHVRELFPDAVSMRTHGLYQSTSFLARAADAGIRHDVSLFLPGARHLAPVPFRYDGARLTRFPYFWEDDVAMEDPDETWSLDAHGTGPGLRIYDFHPVHVALNTSSLARYRALKALKPLAQWDEDFIEEHRQPGPGPGTLFLELAAELAGGGETIAGLAARFGKP
ncbi:MAG: hypothetical protein ACOZEN_11865 [Thermodesulfobacteriota bacterium]